MHWILIIISLSWLSPMSNSGMNFHDIHLSKCRMKYSKEHRSLQITLHIFLDDLESDMSTYGGAELKLCTSHEDPEAERYIGEYLADKFSVMADNEEKKLEFLGKEISEDLAGVWCYLEIPDIMEPSSLSVRYDVLLSKYDDQKNLLSYVGASGKEDFLTFDKLGEYQKIEHK
jgi:hypothetical protein